MISNRSTVTGPLTPPSSPGISSEKEILADLFTRGIQTPSEKSAICMAILDVIGELCGNPAPKEEIEHLQKELSELAIQPFTATGWDEKKFQNINVQIQKVLWEHVVYKNYKYVDSFTHPDTKLEYLLYEALPGMKMPDSMISPNPLPVQVYKVRRGNQVLGRCWFADFGEGPAQAQQTSSSLPRGYYITTLARIPGRSTTLKLETPPEEMEMSMGAGAKERKTSNKIRPKIMAKLSGPPRANPLARPKPNPNINLKCWIEKQLETKIRNEEIQHAQKEDGHDVI